MRGPLIGIGGGGFLLDDARLLQERWLLSHVRARGDRPRVVFVGTALGDAQHAQLKFLQAWLKLGCDPVTLPFFPFDMRRDYAATVRDADLVYVGGGNTVAMLAVWRVFGFDDALREAWEGGTALAGISAGANCWFERYVTDSVPGGGVREGLGWVPGTFCPHLDGEPWRQPLLAAVEAPAWGAPDGALLRFEDGACVEAVADRPGVEAVARLSSDPELRPIPTALLSRS